MKIKTEQELRVEIKILKNEGKDLIIERCKCSFFQFGKREELTEKIYVINKKIEYRSIILDILYE